MQLCAITDRRLYAADERERCAALLRQVERWVAAGVGTIQLREKDLPPEALADLAERLVELVRRTGSRRTRLLLNVEDASGAAEMACKAGVDGVHLPAASWLSRGAGIAAARAEWARSNAAGTPPPVSVACHTVAEAAWAKEAGASLILFAPVFEKQLPTEEALLGIGLESLAQACAAAAGVQVFALGGVTEDNAPACVAAGAVGVAGIRLFAGERWLGLIER